MTVLLTGADGYLGWPTALRLADRLDERIVCVDNFARRSWVAESGSVSATRVESPEERFDAVENLSLVEGDLADRDFVLQLLETYEPDTVLHAAAQPSAPYSSINGERALYTQRNNVSMNLNLLHGLAECGLDDTHFIETTTTGIYGAPHFPIPEGVWRSSGRTVATRSRSRRWAGAGTTRRSRSTRRTCGSRSRSSSSR